MALYLHLVMVNEIRTINPHWLNKGLGLKFHVASQIWQETLKDTLAKIFWIW